MIQFDQHIFPDGLVQPPPRYPFSHNHGSVENRAPKWFRKLSSWRYIHFPSKKPWFWRILLLSPYILPWIPGFLLTTSGWMTILMIYQPNTDPMVFWGQFRRCRSLHHAVGLPGGVSTWLVRLVGGKDVWGSQRWLMWSSKAQPRKKQP